MVFLWFSYGFPRSSTSSKKSTSSSIHPAGAMVPWRTFCWSPPSTKTTTAASSAAPARRLTRRSMATGGWRKRRWWVERMVVKNMGKIDFVYLSNSIKLCWMIFLIDSVPWSTIQLNSKTSAVVFLDFVFFWFVGWFFLKVCFWILDIFDMFLIFWTDSNFQAGPVGSSPGFFNEYAYPNLSGWWFGTCFYFSIWEWS